MANTPHELAEDFPDQVDRIRELRLSNNRFARLYDEYHEVNRTVHRVETRVEATSEDVEEELKRQRVRLKDEIFQMLNGAETTEGEGTGGSAEAVNAPKLRGGANA